VEPKGTEPARGFRPGGGLRTACAPNVATTPGGKAHPPRTAGGERRAAPGPVQPQACCLNSRGLTPYQRRKARLKAAWLR